MATRAQLFVALTEPNNDPAGIANELALLEMSSLTTGSAHSVLRFENQPDGVVVCRLGHLQCSIGVDEIKQDLLNEWCFLADVLRRLLGHASEDVPPFDGVASEVRDICSANPRLTDVQGLLAQPPILNQILAQLEQRHSVALIGASSSGKTVVCDLARNARIGRGDPVRWIDFSRPGLTSVSCILAMLASVGDAEATRKPLVVMDDIQSNPVTASECLFVYERCMPEFDLLVAGWPDAVPFIDERAPSIDILHLDGSTTTQAIAQAAQASWEVGEQILALSAGDALIASLATTFYTTSGILPSLSEISGLAFSTFTRGTALSQSEMNAVYRLGCLSMFEIDADPQYLDPLIRQSLRELLTAGIVRERPPFITVGHRSLAGLLVRHCEHLLSEERLELQPPASIAVDYLRAAGPRQTKQTLDRLDLVTLETDQDRFGAAFLAHSWRSLGVLVRFLSEQVNDDPTWGDNVASAVFAAEAFASLGLERQWGLTANYVRNRWAVHDGSALPVYTEDAPAEADDFTTILEVMREEIAEGPSEDGHAQIDADRFHRTWVLGLLLGFEGTALIVDGKRRVDLVATAHRAQLPSGAFYPAEVPWVTARVVIGLSALRGSREVEEIISRATQWLRSRRPTGPYSFGIWRSGTGRWNTDLQMTGMALLALGRGGVGASDPAVRAGINYLRAGRSEWYRPGKEIDCAQVVEAALLLGGNWRDFAQEIRSLLTWAQDVNAWTTATSKASEVQDESSKVSAVASSLITIIWETVRRELAILFEGIADSALLPTTATPDSQPQLAWLASARHALDRVLARCDSFIGDREQAVARGRASSNMRQSLSEWRSMRDRTDALLDELGRLDQARSNVDPDDVLTRVNAVGAEVLGDAWVVVNPT